MTTAPGHHDDGLTTRYSVVIPARNEQDVVAHAIRSAKNQSVGRDQVEIIVVDNGSTDRTSAIALAEGADLVVHEAIPGTNRARQRGMSVSSGEIIAFLDADCEAPVDWLLGHYTVLRTRHASASSGPYDYHLPGVRGRAVKWCLHFAFPIVGWCVSRVSRRPTRILFGGNFALTRDAVRRVGVLPPLPFFGDDTAIAVAVAEKAGPVAYETTLIVRSSPRRLQAYGVLRMGLVYAYHYFRFAFASTDRILSLAAGGTDSVALPNASTLSERA